MRKGPLPHHTPELFAKELADVNLQTECVCIDEESEGARPPPWGGGQCPPLPPLASLLCTIKYSTVNSVYGIRERLRNSSSSILCKVAAIHVFLA